MQQTSIGLSGLKLWIPRAWTKFIYKGNVYERLDGVAFTRVGSTDDLSLSQTKNEAKTA